MPIANTVGVRRDIYVFDFSNGCFLVSKKWLFPCQQKRVRVPVV
jgi:hypothetical protein